MPWPVADENMQECLDARRCRSWPCKFCYGPAVTAGPAAAAVARAPLPHCRRPQPRSTFTALRRGRAAALNPSG